MPQAGRFRKARCSKPCAKPARSTKPQAEFRDHDSVVVESLARGENQGPPEVYVWDAKISDSYAERILLTGPNRTAWGRAHHLQAGPGELAGTQVTFHPVISVRLPEGMKVASMGRGELARAIAAVLRKAADSMAAKMATAALHAETGAARKTRQPRRAAPPARRRAA
jgi:hypothetical protein